jgi:myo-inositol-1(or 4)-monophosphatase
MIQLEKLTLQVCDLARVTGQFIKDELEGLTTSDIQIKGEHNFVTYVDKTAEARIVKKLSELLPGSGFIAEESPTLQPADLTWIIDPLDGTTNFIHGVPLYSISIGLMEKGEMILGVILEVNQDECFYTWKGAPSYLNGKVIRVTETTQLCDTLFATGFPYYDYGRLDAFMNFLKYMMKNSHGIRRLGSAAADLAYVACGRFDGFYEYGLSPWDVAAGALIVQNAGGRVSDFSGGNDYIFGKEIIATNTNVYMEFMKVFGEEFRS